MIYLAHLPFMVTALAYVVRDMFWLRAIAAAASAGMVTVNIVIIAQQDWAWGPAPAATVAWHSVFMAINVAHLAVLIASERTIRFPDDQERLYQSRFGDFTRLDFLRLLRLAERRIFDADGRIATQDEPLPDLLLLTDGAADVFVDGRRVNDVAVGQFIGEMSYLTKEAASATVTARGPCVCLAWPKPVLSRFLKRNPSIRTLLMTTMGADLSRKLKHHDESEGPTQGA